MLLAVLLTGLIATLTWNNDFLQAKAAEPGYLDFDNLPETNFSCESKVIGGYYADVETGCQMFHVCTIGQKGEVADIKFLCLNGTVFDQETRVCERLDEVDCSKSESYYDLNLELYGNSGATYGIQPENEEEPPTSNNDDEDKCVEDEEDCKTEPQEPLSNKPAELEDEYEELEEAVDPTTSSTTSTTTTTTQRPTRPTTSSRPAQVSYPTSSPETIAALLALHNAFQESLKEHERPPPPRVSNSFPSPIPVKTPQSPPRFSSPVSFSTSPRPLSFAQNFPGSNHQPSLPQQPQVSNHHFPAPQSHKQPLPQPFPFNVTPKPKPVSPFTSTIRTSQAFGNSNFQQSFREEQQQQQKLLPQEEDEEYSVEDYDLIQPSSPRPLYNAYKHNQNRFAISHQDTNPTAAPSNFLLHQLKLRFNDNPPQKHSGAHGFTRAVSNHDTKILTYPEKPIIPVSRVASSTTPAAVSVVLSKTSTTSVVRSVSSRNQSAISHVHPPAYNATKYFPTSTLKPSTTTVANISQPLEEDYKTEEEYDYYQEELGPDPFYKDVPKLERQKRSLENETDFNDILKLRKKYVMLWKYTKNKQNNDLEEQNKLKEKLALLKEKIKAAESEISSQKSSITKNKFQTGRYKLISKRRKNLKASVTNPTSTTEEDIENNTFPTFTPPTPPASHYLTSPSPELGHFQPFEFTLQANISYDNPLVISVSTTAANTKYPAVPHFHLINDLIKQNQMKASETTMKVPMNDVVDLSEDVLTSQVLTKRKLVHEDYFGSLLSSQTESIGEMLQRIRSKYSHKGKPQVNDPALWFSSNDTNLLLGCNFNKSLCTGEYFYNEFIDSNKTDANLTSSPRTQLHVGTRYIKLCNQCVSQKLMLVFLIETRYLLDLAQYMEIKADSKMLPLGKLVDMIGLQSRIKVLQFKQKENAFKVVRELSTTTNPRIIVKNIVERIEASTKREK